MNTLKVIIADDHGITSLGLNLLCKEALPNSVIHEIDSIGNLYKSLKEIKPDLLILDLLINEINCISVIPEILRIQPGLNILVITMADEATYGNRIILTGAKGYVNKLNDNDIIKTAITRVSQGLHYISQEMYINNLNAMGQKPEDLNPFKKLTDKEIEIVHYLISGLSTSEIGVKARIALSTVSTYKRRIFEKLGVDNLIGLINLANTFDTIE